MKMKKIVALLLTALMVASVGGCSSKSSSSSSATGKNGKTKISAYLGGGDTIDQITALVKNFNEESKTTEVELVPLPQGSNGYQMLTIMYNAGNPPTTFYLEPGDVMKLSSKLMDLSKMDCVQYAAKGSLDDVRADGKLYGVPAFVQGYGLIYNRKILNDTMGENFDPATIKTREDLKKVFAQIQKKGIAPVVITPADWSLAGHYLNQVYSGQSDTVEGKNKFMGKLKDGTGDLTNNVVFNDYMDTFDLMKQYNYYKENTLETAADGIDKQAQVLTLGKAAFWFQGNWASTSISTLDPKGDYGYIPVPLDKESANKGKVCTLVPGYYGIENTKSTPAQQKSAKELIDYITMSEKGAQYVVDTNNIPVYTNSKAEPKGSLAKSILNYQKNNKTFPMYIKCPSNYIGIMGAPFQKYLDSKIDRTEFVKEINNYWSKQK